MYHYLIISASLYFPRWLNLKNGSYRDCCITWNNPPLPKIGPFSKLPDQITYLVWGLECGKAGTQHWQMNAEFKDAVTVATSKKLFGNDTIHIAKRRGTAAQAAAYCKKLDETHLS